MADVNNQNLPNQQTLAIILAATGSMLFALKAILMKIAYVHGGGVEMMMALRMGISLPIFLTIGYLSRPQGVSAPPKKFFVYAGGLGILSFYVCTWLDFTALKYITAQLERLILFLYPTFTALFAMIFLKDRLTWRHGSALALSYVGVAVLALHEIEDVGSNAVLGGALVLLAAILFAAYVTASKPVIARLGAPLYTSVTMVVSAIAILVHFSFLSVTQGPPTISPTLFWLGAAMAVLCTVLPTYMMAEAIARIGPGLASAVGGIGPVATAIFAIVLLNEPFGWPQAVALVLTTVGILLLTQSDNQGAAQASNPAHDLISQSLASEETAIDDRTIHGPESVVPKHS